MRTILDGVEPDHLRPLFKEVFSQLQRGKVLEKLTFMGKYYLVSVDGTGVFQFQGGVLRLLLGEDTEMGA